MRFDWGTCAADWSDEQRAEFKRRYNADEPTVWPRGDHEPGECACCDSLRAIIAECDAEGD